MAKFLAFALFVASASAARHPKDIKNRQDCYPSHNGWDDYWDDMYPEQQAAWSILGWDAQGWDNMENEYSWNLAGEHLFCWEDGTPAQQDAAKSLCFHQDTWNALMVNEHGMNCAFEQKGCTPEQCCGSKSTFEDEYWMELSPEIQDLWRTLGWNADMWDYYDDYWYNYDYNFINMCWSDLTDAQMTAAESLCYDEAMWNDEANTYMVDYTDYDNYEYNAC